MSEIATLENLERHLAHPVAEKASAPAASGRVAPTAPSPSGRQGSQLEIFFSEVQYSTFVARKPQSAPARSSNSAAGTLKYRLRLH
jgi:hypothetical protein